MIKDIKRRLPVGVLLILSSIMIVSFIFNQYDAISQNHWRIFLLGFAFAYLFFSIAFIPFGFGTSLSLSGYFTATVIVILLPDRFKFWTALLFLGGSALFDYIKKQRQNSTLKNDLLENNREISEIVAAEISDALENVTLSLSDVVALNAHILLEEMGQIFLLYKASVIHHVYRSFVMEDTLYFCRSKITNQAPPMSAPFTKEEAENEFKKHSSNLKIALRDISDVVISKKRASKRYFIALSFGEKQIILKSNGSILEDILYFFTTICKQEIKNTVPLQSKENSLEVTRLPETIVNCSEKELDRRRKARRLLKGLNFLALVFSIWLFIPNSGDLMLKIIFNMLLPVAGYGLYIVYSPLLSLDSNNRGAPIIVGVTMMAPIILPLFFLVIVGKNNNSLLIKWIILSAIIDCVLSCILYLTTTEYKSNKSLQFGIPFFCFFSALGIGAGLMILFRHFLKF